MKPTLRSGTRPRMVLPLSLVTALLIGNAHAATLPPCGDCDLNGVVNILDSLLGAQDAVGLLLPSVERLDHCDVDISGAVTILDALLIAEIVAGLRVQLTCQLPPEVELVVPAPPLFGDVPLSYSLRDPQGSAADVRLDVSVDGGLSWRAATPTLSTVTRGLDAPIGTPATHLFVWDTIKDFGYSTADDLLLRMIATDGLSGHDSRPSLAGPVDVSNLDVGAWELLSAGGVTPSPRYGAAAVSLSPTRLEIYMGGRGVVRLTDSRALNVGASPLTWLNPVIGAEPAIGRMDLGGVYDPLGNVSLLYGGETAGGTLLDEVIMFSGSTHTWAVLPVGARPAARKGSAVVYDPVRLRMLVFGGMTASGATDEVWALSLSRPIPGPWSQLPSAGFGARTQTAVAYDPQADLFFLFGGRDGAGAMQDLLSFDPRAETFSPVITAGPQPAARAGARLLHDPTTLRLILAGGDNPAGTPDDINTLDRSVSPPRWRPIGITSPTRPGSRALAAWHLGPGGDLYLFGGRTVSSSPVGDLWRLIR